MKLRINKKQDQISGTIQLTGSKSESNRALIIKSLCSEGFELNNLSEAQDTVTLKNILNKKNELADVGPAGTAMRFLAARLCLQEGSFVLTGTERMKQRPIGILTEALKELGAQIEYTEKEGFPPLKITGGNIQGGKINIDGSVSSQFISALCLIAPSLHKGLELEFDGEIASRPYLDMTLAIQAHFGIKHQWKANNLSIPAQPYQTTNFTIEPDWSAASYWYSVVALCKAGSIELPNLKKNSLQGDAVIAQVFQKLGVNTIYTKQGIQIEKMEGFHLPEFIEIDCEKCPDLAQTFATTIAGLGISGKLSGLKSLRIKETDRITALINELAKFGITAQEEENFVLTIQSGTLKQPSEPIHTYEDHRMAMAFAPLILKVDQLEFDDALVVNKSYPDFWKHLEEINIIH